VVDCRKWLWRRLGEAEAERQAAEIARQHERMRLVSELTDVEEQARDLFAELARNIYAPFLQPADDHDTDGEN